MTDADYAELERRLAAVERTVCSGSDEPTDGAVDECNGGPPADLAEELDAVERRIDDLDAGLQAVRGLLGGIRAVDRDVERRADLALARVDDLEKRLGVDAEEAGPTDTVDSGRPPESEGSRTEPDPSVAEEREEEETGSLAGRLRESL